MGRSKGCDLLPCINCALLLLTGGCIAMLVFGVKDLTKSNTRDAEVAAFNAAVVRWNDPSIAGAAVMRNTAGNVTSTTAMSASATFAAEGRRVAAALSSTTPEGGTGATLGMERITAAVAISGSTDGVDVNGATTVYLQQRYRVPPAPTTAAVGLVFKFDVSNNGNDTAPSATSTTAVSSPFSTPAIPAHRTVKRYVSCADYRCPSSAIAKDCNGVTTGRFRCPDGVNGYWCGWCAETKFLTGLCLQMQWEPSPSSSSSSPQGRWSVLSKSCHYPFQTSFANDHLTLARYDSYSFVSEVPVQLRASTDPVIALENVTSGSNDFGESAAEQKTRGIALTVAGAAGIVLFCGSCIAGVVFLCTWKPPADGDNNGEGQGGADAPQQAHGEGAEVLMVPPHKEIAPNEMTVLAQK